MYADGYYHPRPAGILIVLMILFILLFVFINAGVINSQPDSTPQSSNAACPLTGKSTSGSSYPTRYR